MKTILSPWLINQFNTAMTEDRVIVIDSVTAMSTAFTPPSVKEPKQVIDVSTKWIPPTVAKRRYK